MQMRHDEPGPYRPVSCRDASRRHDESSASAWRRTASCQSRNCAARGGPWFSAICTRAWKRIADKGGRSILARSRAYLCRARSANSGGASNKGNRNRVVASGMPAIASLPVRATRDPKIRFGEFWSACLASCAKSRHDLVTGFDWAVRHWPRAAALWLPRCRVRNFPYRRRGVCAATAAHFGSQTDHHRVRSCGRPFDRRYPRYFPAVD